MRPAPPRHRPRRGRARRPEPQARTADPDGYRPRLEDAPATLLGVGALLHVADEALDRVVRHVGDLPQREVCAFAKFEMIIDPKSARGVDSADDRRTDRRRSDSERKMRDEDPVGVLAALDPQLRRQQQLGGLPGNQRRDVAGDSTTRRKRRRAQRRHQHRVGDRRVRRGAADSTRHRGRFEGRRRPTRRQVPVHQRNRKAG